MRTGWSPSIIPARGGGSTTIRGLVEPRLRGGLARAAPGGPEEAHDLAAEDGQVLRRAAGYEIAVDNDIKDAPFAFYKLCFDTDFI